VDVGLFLFGAEIMIRIRQGDVKTLYVQIKDDNGDPLLGSYCYMKYYDVDAGTYTIKGTATCQSGTVFYQIPAAILANEGTFRAHWETTFTNNDMRTYIQDIEVWALWPTLPTLYYGDIATLKRYVRNVAGHIEIGNSFSAHVSEVSACDYIRDGEKYVDGKLKEYVVSTGLPISSPTSEIQLAANLMGAWFLVNSTLLVNAPGEMPAAIDSLKTMADTLIDGYIAQLKASGDAISAEDAQPSFQEPSKAFSERGVSGVTSGELEGVQEDEDIDETVS